MSKCRMVCFSACMQVAMESLSSSGMASTRGDLNLGVLGELVKGMQEIVHRHVLVGGDRIMPATLAGQEVVSRDDESIRYQGAGRYGNVAPLLEAESAFFVAQGCPPAFLCLD